MTGRGQLLAVAGLTAAGGVLLLLAAGQPWARLSVRPPPPLPATTELVTGRQLAPLLPAVGLLGLASVAALAATRGAGRRLVGVVLAAAGVAVAVVTALTVAGDVATLPTAPGAPRSGPVTAVRTPWPAAAVAGGLLLTTAGVLAVARGPRWPRLEGRYEAPRRRPEAARDLWDAMDRGEDPTTRS